MGYSTLAKNYKMAKLIVSMMVSLDGFIEGPNKELDWHVFDDEMEAFMLKFFDGIGTLLFGRVNYQLMEQYWPSGNAKDDQPRIAAFMNELPKIVYSKTLTDVQWQNARLGAKDIRTEVEELKKESAKNLVVFGGANIVHHLIDLNLIDEFQMIINPIILGGGTPFFKEPTKMAKLDLISSRQMACGNVVLTYRYKKEPEI